MRTDKQMEKQASHIADAIVDLVERTDAPVTLARIDREIPGFATNEHPAWEYLLENENGEAVIWTGMTHAGRTALSKVIRGRKVAVQFVNLLPYILEHCRIDDEHWCPIVLLPARVANLETPAFPLMRASKKQQDYWIKRATAEGKTGNRLLTPGSECYMADCFSLL